MDPEIELTSAAEALEIKVTSAAEGPEIKVTSAAEGPEVGGTSSAEVPEVRRYWKYDSTSSSDSIFCAPAHIRYGRESDFERKLVSIGPYHRGRPNLQPMEETKVWCMSNLLTMRPGDGDNGENEFLFYNRGGSNMDCVAVGPFMKFESRARSFYKEKFDQISVVEFVGMLLLDSCFVIRFFLSLCGLIPQSMGSVEVNIKEVRSDLLLLENQIPLFFLNVVYYWLFPNAKSIDLIYLLLVFIEHDLPWQRSFNCMDFESDHLLDFYWKSSVPETEQLIEIMKSHRMLQKPSSAPDRRILLKFIANATELHQIAGIKFETDYYQGLQVEFSKGIMRMVCLQIDSSLANSLVNIIAFENSMETSLRIISTYVKFLVDLIDSEKDVELLQKFGIINNTLTSHRKAATFFNYIGKLSLIQYSDNPFSDLFMNVDKYYTSSRNRRWAILKREWDAGVEKYFSSPWSVISVFAGVVLLFLSAVQTYYTVFPRN